MSCALINNSFDLTIKNGHPLHYHHIFYFKQLAVGSIWAGLTDLFPLEVIYGVIPVKTAKNANPISLKEPLFGFGFLWKQNIK